MAFGLIKGDFKGSNRQKNTPNLARKYGLILKIRVDSTSKRGVLRFFEKNLTAKRKFLVVTPNPEIVMRAQKDKELAKILNSADLAIPDGIGLVWASKFSAFSKPAMFKLFKLFELFNLNKGEARSNILNKRAKRAIKLNERVSGTDVVEELVKIAARKNWRLFFLGGRDDVAEKAAKKLSISHQSLTIAYDSGPWLDENGRPKNKKEERKEKEVIVKINKFSPQILFVGFGAPKQEKWSWRTFKKLKVNGVMVVGGAFDYLSGRTKRAAEVIRLIGFEWFFRLLIEPWRLKRQLALIRFVFAAVKETIVL